MFSDELEYDEQDRNVYYEDMTFFNTSIACPEQYDAVSKDGKMLGYIRLRHGNFTVTCPDVGGTLVYRATTKGDGCFKEDERKYFLNMAHLGIRSYHSLPL